MKNKKKEYITPAKQVKVRFLVEKIYWSFKEIDWKMKLTVSTVLDKSFHSYQVKMIFNEDPYLDQIDDNEDKIKAIKKEMKNKPSLFGKDEDDRKDDLKKAEFLATKIKKEMEEMRKLCPEIFFITELDTVDWQKGGQTVLTWNIPDSVMGEVNERKRYFGKYILELTPYFKDNN